METSKKSRSCSSSSLAEQNVMEDVDWFSFLPDHVTLRILSFLSMEDIARLSFPSKKCEKLCFCIPSLIISDSQIKFRLQRVQFFNFLIRFMRDRQNAEMKKLHIQCLTLGLQNGVFEMPLPVFYSETLNSLMGTFESLPYKNDFPHLKCLSLIRVEITGKYFGEIQNLNMAFDPSCTTSFLIYAPNLHEFYWDTVFIDNYFLERPISLHHAFLSLWHDDDYLLERFKVKCILPSVDQVSSLNIIWHTIKVLYERNCLPYMFTNLQSLELNLVEPDDSEDQALASLLQGMPRSLKKLLIRHSYCEPFSQSEHKSKHENLKKFWESRNFQFVQGLEEIHIEDGIQDICEVTLLEYLLENAKQLKKLSFEWVPSIPCDISYKFLDAVARGASFLLQGRMMLIKNGRSVFYLFEKTNLPRLQYKITTYRWSLGGKLYSMLRTERISRHLTLLKSHSNFNKQQSQSLSENLISLLERCKYPKPVQQIHTQMLITSFPNPNFLLSKIIDLKDFDYASLLFNRIKYPTDYAFNVMIRGLATTWQKHSLALQLYDEMINLGLMPNKFTFPFLFIACANLLALNYGKSVHSSAFKFGLDCDDHVYHSLLTMYARCGQLGFARKVFDEISERDLVSWNSMISGYAKMGYAEEGLKLFGRMKEEGFEPNEMTIVSVLKACGDLGDLSSGRLLEGLVVEKEMQLSSYIGSALINMYAKCGDLSSARRVFDDMKRKDVVTWNAMITGYAQNGKSNEGIMLFHEMRKAGANPNNITLSSVLSACGSIGALDLGEWVEKYASEKGLLHDIFVSSALIDMYAKCGSLDNALRVFEDMPQKNEVSWNSLISALAFHGRPQEALSLFKRMEENGSVRPDEITFVGILSACVHAGLVDEGRWLFDLMSSSYAIFPRIEHYSCMVDLLARAGYLEEAWNFVEKMPEKPDEIVLGALLGACKKQRNTEISERVIKLLLEIEPSNSGNYVISSKIYSNLKMWDNSAKMWVLMREKGITKTPGCSWIEIDARLHEFHAGDSLDHYETEIHHLFDLLIEEMKKEGYIPDLNCL
ncbi:pentatricopeptide repeat-containing protein At2g34400-like [Rutidosis leptorrhynchoides]|uniref:pentatricopeptide repeat-containing protein At2g34400-like n=1 Tax=Rutidosis leptorrhynchoides TaxID=125765 RepID=UPI003A993AAC